jgi:hypothetical protein
VTSVVVIKYCLVSIEKNFVFHSCVSSPFCLVPICAICSFYFDLARSGFFPELFFVGPRDYHRCPIALTGCF